LVLGSAYFLEFQKDDSAVQIPLIDFSKFRKAASPAEKRQVSDELVQGFKDVGFIYLKNHGIPESDIANVFQKVRAACADKVVAIS